MDRVACGNCGASDYSHWRKVYPEKRESFEVCDKCEKMKRPNTYDDVYKGDCNNGITTDENLCDKDTGQPIPYSSVGEKAAIMKSLDLRQAPSADAQHGARNEVKRRTYFA